MPANSLATRAVALGIAAAMLLSTSPAAASSQTGRIAILYVRASDGLIFLELEGPVRDGRPACAEWGYWMVRDENSATGKRQYALLLAAKASGRTVTIHGSGQCSRWSNGEDIDTLQLQD